MGTAAIVAHQSSYTPEQVDLLKRTICRGASDDEFALFLGQCKRTGLDPFSRQIHAVKRFNSKAKRDEMTIQVGIDGFRLVAQRTNELDGQEGPWWADKEGVWHDVWVDDSVYPIAAKVQVFRRGCAHGFIGIAKWSEYAVIYEGKPNQFWAKMPTNQLAKCAEALALRKAFPQELSGLYTPEEMNQADGSWKEGVEAAAEVAQKKLSDYNEKTAAQMKGQIVEAYEITAADHSVYWGFVDSPALAFLLDNGLKDLCKFNHSKRVHYIPHDQNVWDVVATCAMNFGIEIKQASSSTAAQNGGAKPAPSIIKAANEVTNKGKTKLVVNVSTGDLANTMTCWKESLFETIKEGIGKEAEFVVESSGKWLNIVGLKRIGRQTYSLLDDKYVPDIQHGAELFK